MPASRGWLVADDDYVERDAIVRMPKDERLADSKKTEGWSRGFTPKSPDKGPQHVEIRLVGDGKNHQSEPEPHDVYGDRYLEPTWGQELTAAIVMRVIDHLIEAATPRVAHWWDTVLIPAMKAKWDDFVLKGQAQKAKKVTRAKVNTSALVAAHVGADGPAAQEVTTAFQGQKITMTSDQYQQLVLTLLAIDEIRDKLLQVLANAHVDDSDPAALAQLQELRELPPQQRAERVEEILVGNPWILENLGRHLMEFGPGELPAPVRSP
jgi:hypothetical protein